MMVLSLVRVESRGRLACVRAGRKEKATTVRISQFVGQSVSQSISHPVDRTIGWSCGEGWWVVVGENGDLAPEAEATLPQLFGPLEVPGVPASEWSLEGCGSWREGGLAGWHAGGMAELAILPESSYRAYCPACRGFSWW